MSIEAELSEPSLDYQSAVYFYLVGHGTSASYQVDSGIRHQLPEANLAITLDTIHQLGAAGLVKEKVNHHRGGFLWHKVLSSSVRYDAVTV